MLLVEITSAECANTHVWLSLSVQKLIQQSYTHVYLTRKEKINYFLRYADYVAEQLFQNMGLAGRKFKRELPVLKRLENTALFIYEQSSIINYF